MRQNHRSSLESSPIYATVATGSLPADMGDVGYNVDRKTGDKVMPRVLRYSGACTVKDASGTSRTLIATDAYENLTIQFTEVTSAANDVFVMW